MDTWALVPVRQFPWLHRIDDFALSETQRNWLRIGLFEQTLKKLLKVRGIRDVMVLSWDTQLLAAARALGAHTIHESRSGELGTELLRATQCLKSWWVSDVLIVPADLPLLRSDDIEKIIHLGRYANSIVLAPDRTEQGTNLLFLRPPDLVPYAFGSGSFTHNLELARKSGAVLQVYRSYRVALDIDTPDDLRDYLQLMGNQHQSST